MCFVQRWKVSVVAGCAALEVTEHKIKEALMAKGPPSLTNCQPTPIFYKVSRARQNYTSPSCLTSTRCCRVGSRWVSDK